MSQHSSIQNEIQGIVDLLASVASPRIAATIEASKKVDESVKTTTQLHPEDLPTALEEYLQLLNAIRDTRNCIAQGVDLPSFNLQVPKIDNWAIGVSDPLTESLMHSAHLWMPKELRNEYFLAVAKNDTQFIRAIDRIGLELQLRMPVKGTAEDLINTWNEVRQFKGNIDTLNEASAIAYLYFTDEKALPLWMHALGSDSDVCCGIYALQTLSDCTVSSRIVEPSLPTAAPSRSVPPLRDLISGAIDQLLSDVRDPNKNTFASIISHNPEARLKEKDREQLINNITQIVSLGCRDPDAFQLKNGVHVSGSILNWVLLWQDSLEKLSGRCARNLSCSPEDILKLCKECDDYLFEVNSVSTCEEIVTNKVLSPSDILSGLRIVLNRPARDSESESYTQLRRHLRTDASRIVFVDFANTLFDYISASFLLNRNADLLGIPNVSPDLVGKSGPSSDYRRLFYGALDASTTAIQNALAINLSTPNLAEASNLLMYTIAGQTLLEKRVQSRFEISSDNKSKGALIRQQYKQEFLESVLAQGNFSNPYNNEESIETALSLLGRRVDRWALQNLKVTTMRSLAGSDVAFPIERNLLSIDVSSGTTSTVAQVPIHPVTQLVYGNETGHFTWTDPKDFDTAPSVQVFRALQDLSILPTSLTAEQLSLTVSRPKPDGTLESETFLGVSGYNYHGFLKMRSVHGKFSQRPSLVVVSGMCLFDTQCALAITTGANGENGVASITNPDEPITEYITDIDVTRNPSLYEAVTGSNLSKLMHQMYKERNVGMYVLHPPHVEYYLYLLDAYQEKRISTETLLKWFDAVDERARWSFSVLNTLVVGHEKHHTPVVRTSALEPLARYIRDAVSAGESVSLDDAVAILTADPLWKTLIESTHGGIKSWQELSYLAYSYPLLSVTFRDPDAIAVGVYAPIEKQIFKSCEEISKKTGLNSCFTGIFPHEPVQIHLRGGETPPKTLYQLGVPLRALDTRSIGVHFGIKSLDKILFSGDAF